MHHNMHAHKYITTAENNETRIYWRKLAQRDTANDSTFAQVSSQQNITRGSRVNNMDLYKVGQQQKTKFRKVLKFARLSNPTSEKSSMAHSNCLMQLFEVYGNDSS
jgi:hypothetical protein